MSLIVSPGGRRYGRYPDNPYHPDRIRLAVKAPAGIVLPPKASTSQWAGYIRDQLQTGSCTGQMKAEIRDWTYRKLFQFEKSKDVPIGQFRTSASFAYKTNLIADGDLGQDAGSTIHQSFITLNQHGVCLESIEPYTDSDFSVAPTPAQYANALLYKGGPYHFLPDLLSMKACIASGYAFGFGIDVFESFEGQQLADTGFMPMPAASENLLGGHAQFGMDYDDGIEFPDGSLGGVFTQNSWGSEWGISIPGRTDRGCYWMPYAYFLTPHVSDSWVQHEGKPWTALPVAA